MLLIKDAMVWLKILKSWGVQCHQRREGVGKNAKKLGNVVPRIKDVRVRVKRLKNWAA